MKAEYLIKTFSYGCKRDLDGVDSVDSKLETDLYTLLKSIEEPYVEHSVVAISHSYVGQYVNFVVTIKRTAY